MDEASNTAASNSGEKQKFFAGSVTFCGQRYTCQCRGSSSKSASAVGVDAVHSRSRRRSVTDVGLPLAGTHRPGSLHRFYENLRRIRGCPRGRQSRRPLQRPLLSPVGADDSVRPQTAPVFTGTFGEFATSSRADVGIGPYMTPANSHRPAKFNRRASLPQPFKGSCYQIWCIVTGGAYQSAREVTWCVRNDYKNRFLPELYPQDAPNASQRPFSPPSFPARRKRWGRRRRVGNGLDGYIKQPHSGRMGLFMHMGGGSYSAEMR